MTSQESPQIRFWTFALLVLTITAVFLTTRVYPFEVSLAYLALLAGVIAVGLLTHTWGGLLASAVAVSAIVFFNQYLGIYPRENWIVNIATGLIAFMAAGPLAGILATHIDRLQVQANQWRTQAETQNAHDTQFGILKPEWALVRLNEEITRATRYHYPLSLALLEFQPTAVYAATTLSDEQSAVLQGLVRIAQALTDTPDSVTLIGSRQILLILPHQTAAEAESLGQQMAARLEQERYFPADVPLGKSFTEWGTLVQGTVQLNGHTPSAEGLLSQAKARLAASLTASKPCLN